LALTLADLPHHPQYRHLSTLPVAVDLRYAGAQNFVGRSLYRERDCAWLHVDAATALERSAAWLTSQSATLRLLVLDALRPHSVQIELWALLGGTPLAQYIANPAIGSIHAYGMAVDVTLIDAAGRELDMGTGFDDMCELSHPAREADFLASGDITPGQVGNRQRLRTAMAAGGFVGIGSEWWHFDCGDKARVRREFARVE
jgi:D-alanyl-D-alanine dipeptidase